jgi:hypothetical protein
MGNDFFVEKFPEAVPEDIMLRCVGNNVHRLLPPILSGIQSCFVQTWFPGLTASGTKHTLERKEKMGYWFYAASLPTIILEKNFF